MDEVPAGLSIFEEMSLRARQAGAINLGQGFPDGDGPLAVRQAAAEAVLAGTNQYPPMRGLPALREAVSTHYARVHAITIAPEQVLVTSGATEALAAAIHAVIRPGDEIILIEPTYDAYAPLVVQAGGVARFVRLDPPHWRLTAEMLEQAIGPRTRAILLNNPHNPIGRMFDAAELAVLAEVCIRHDLIAISDEVWEHVIFDGRVHRPLIGLPGMADRTIKIGSAGKIFSMTGWKVGWIVTAPPLVDAAAKIHQYLTFTTPPPMQAGAATGLALDDAYFADMRAGYQRSRDRFEGLLRAQGIDPLPAEATYFLCLDLATNGITEDDRAFCLRMVAHAGVAMIPMSAFYAADPATNLVRLCFAKEDATMVEAAARIGRAARG